MNKRKGSILFRLYICVFVFLISFFTIYAFRNDVMDLLSKQNRISYKISAEKQQALNADLKDVYADLFNVNEIKEIISRHCEGYEYNVFTYLNPVDSNAYEKVIVNEEGNAGEVETEIPRYFFITSSSGNFTKQSVEYMSSVDVSFQNYRAAIMLYPKFEKYYNLYRTIDLIVTILITLLVYLLMRYESKHQKIRKKLKKVKKYNALTKLSMNIILVNVITGALAVSCFLLMYQNRYAFFEFVNESAHFEQNYDQTVEKIQDELKSYSMIKKDKRAIIEILNKHADNSYNSYLYDQDGIYFAGQNKNNIQDSFYINSIYDIRVVTSPLMYVYNVDFKDQKAMLNIYSYPLADLVNPYIIVIVILSLSLWFVLLLCFIRKKVFEIKIMQEDVSALSTGDWNHEVHVFGDDEISELANHLNQMRYSFLENMENETQARNANKDLITSLSHDLRTPLTALMGYLDIIKYNKCDPTQKNAYLEKSIQKVEQIRSLSDKMFEYFLIYGKEGNSELQPQSTNEWMYYVEECNSLLIQQNFNVESKWCEQKDVMLNLNMSMMKRIMDNLYSNVQKYADQTSPVVILSEVKESNFRFMMSNKKREDSDAIESNKIGLKSVTKIVEMHHGEIFIQNEEDYFTIVLSFSLINKTNF